VLMSANPAVLMAADMQQWCTDTILVLCLPRELEASSLKMPDGLFMSKFKRPCARPSRLRFYVLRLPISYEFKQDRKFTNTK